MSQKAAKRQRQTQRTPPPPTSSKGTGIPRRWLYAGAGIVGAVILVVAIVISLSGGDSSEPASTSAIDGGTIEQMLEGIPQDGTWIGAPDAPAVLVEFADLQCPFCKNFANSVLPQLIEDYVRPGKVRMEWQGLAFIGPDSETALRFALAAGEQNKLWNVTELLYRYQGGENDGWVTDDLLRGVGEAIPGLDVDKAFADMDSDAVDAGIQASSQRAQAQLPRISTPSFLAGPAGTDPKYLELESLDYETVKAELDKILAG
ncbi:MAG: thioredoxin domain-containing protein [Gaiellales bacterium]